MNPSYVMDEMSLSEMRCFAKNLHKKSRESWEQTRMIAYIIAQTNSTKKLKPTDIIKFEWDEEVKEETSISNNDIERLRNKAAHFIQNNNKLKDNNE